MKYILTESKLNSSIKKQLDVMFDVENINSTNPYEYDDDGNEYEDENRVQFYIGDYGNDDDVFLWYAKEYWGGTESESYMGYKQASPVVEIVSPYDQQLNGLFGHHWFEPFKEWFTENFDLPVKSVMNEIYYKRKSRE